MKTIYHIKASLMALAAMVACTEMEIRDESQDAINNGLLQELSITGKDFQLDGETRSSVTIGESGASFAWDKDDVVGIFPDKGDQVSFAMDDGAGTQTATFSGGGWALKSSSTYAAYYPHVYENRDMTQIPVSYIGQTQNGNANTDHIGAYDFMAAGVSTPENGAVAFEMKHLGALVQLTITVPQPSSLTNVVLTSLNNFTKTGTIDLTAETPQIIAASESNSMEIALNDISTAEVNEEVFVYFMTAPIDISESELTVLIYFADGIVCEEKITGKNLEAGNAYRLAVNIEKSTNMQSDYIDEYGQNHGKGVVIGETIWAPVNCGYHKTNYPYGKLYQWGRKYGQGYSGYLYGGNSYAEKVSDILVPTTKSGGVSLDEGQKLDNANVFYYSTYDSDNDWVSPHDNFLWNLGDEDNPIKTKHDPCPQGWRVPTKTEFEELIINKSSWLKGPSDQSGYYFSGLHPYAENSPRIFLPAAGLLNRDSGSAGARGAAGYYWTSTPTILSGANYVNFDNDESSLGSNRRAYGFSVRCVQY